MSRAPSSGERVWLRRLGLERPEVRAWVAYDWANSAFVTSVVAAVFPIYFVTVAARGLPPGVATRRYAVVTAVTLAVLAIAAPVLGTAADRAGARVRFLRGFVLLGAGATASLAFVGPGEWVLGIALFALANIGAGGSFVFYDALLLHLVPREALDRVSAAGYAVGYLGGGLLLAVHLLWLRDPGAFGLGDAERAARVVFATAALWWIAFALPLLRTDVERIHAAPAGRADRPRIGGIWQTVRALRDLRDARWFLVAFVIYSDGIGTIIRLAAAYGSELGIAGEALVAAILLVQLVAFPCTFLFGRLAERIGAKRALFAAIAVYGLICVLGFAMHSAAHFTALAILVGTVQGGTQAISRSLFASLVPPARSAEFFALFAVTERFAGLVGPLLFAVVGEATGSNRYALLGVIVLFALGAAALAPVDVARGERAVQEAGA